MVGGRDNQERQQDSGGLDQWQGQLRERWGLTAHLRRREDDWAAHIFRENIKKLMPGLKKELEALGRGMKGQDGPGLVWSDTTGNCGLSDGSASMCANIFTQGLGWHTVHQKCREGIVYMLDCPNVQR